MATKKKPQPMTAATIAAEVTMTGSQRMNIAHEILSRPMTFATSKKLGRLYDAVMVDWDASDILPDQRLMEPKDQKQWLVEVKELGKERFELKLTRPVLEDMRQFIHDKLEEKAPKKDGEDDKRWVGLAGIVMRKLYDQIDDILEGREPD